MCMCGLRCTAYSIEEAWGPQLSKAQVALYTRNRANCRARSPIPQGLGDFAAQLVGCVCVIQNEKCQAVAKGSSSKQLASRSAPRWRIVKGSNSEQSAPRWRIVKGSNLKQLTSRWHYRYTTTMVLCECGSLRTPIIEGYTALYMYNLANCRARSPIPKGLGDFAAQLVRCALCNSKCKNVKLLWKAKLKVIGTKMMNLLHIQFGELSRAVTNPKRIGRFCSTASPMYVCRLVMSKVTICQVSKVISAFMERPGVRIWKTLGPCLDQIYGRRHSKIILSDLM